METAYTGSGPYGHIIAYTRSWAYINGDTAYTRSVPYGERIHGSGPYGECIHV